MVVLVGLFGLYATARLGWVTLKSLPGGLLSIFARNTQSAGEVAPLSAFAMSLGATVSAASAVGVAAAIHHGGPGAVFWMWVVALMVAPIKFAQARMYIETRTEAPSKAATPAMLGILAALGWGALAQSAVAAEAVHGNFGAATWAVALVAAVGVTAVAAGGTRAVAAVSTVLVPVAVMGFVTAALALMFFNYRDIPETFGFVRDGLLRLEAGLGGALAGVFTVTMAWGVKAAFFSCEMVSGSGAVVFASARGESSKRLAGLASLTPVIDTLVVSTLVGFCVIITQSWDQKAMSTVPADQAVAMPAHFMEMAGQQTEFQWIEGGLQKLASVPTTTSALEIEVTEGDQTDLFFIVEHGLVDTGLLIDKAGAPYTGPLTVDLVQGTLTPADLQLKGYMLRNRAGLLEQAFSRGFGKATGGLSPLRERGPTVLTLLLVLFALSTMVVWVHVGTHFAEALGGPALVWPFRGAFFAAVLLGGFVPSAGALGTAELLLTALGVVNMVGLVASLGAKKRTP